MATLPSMRAVEDLLEKRVRSLSLLRSAVLGDACFVGAVRLTQADIAGHLGEQAMVASCRQHYVLAVSLGRLLSLHHMHDLLRATAQLMAEFEHFAGDTIVPDALLGMRLLGGSSKDDYFPDTLPRPIHHGRTQPTTAADKHGAGVVDAGSADVDTAVTPSVHVDSAVAADHPSRDAAIPAVSSATTNTATTHSSNRSSAGSGASPLESVPPLTTSLHTAGGHVVYEHLQRPPWVRGRCALFDTRTKAHIHPRHVAFKPLPPFTSIRGMSHSNTSPPPFPPFPSIPCSRLPPWTISQ